MDGFFDHGERGLIRVKTGEIEAVERAHRSRGRPLHPSLFFWNCSGRTLGEPDGEAHQGGADGEADPVGGFAEDDKGDGDGERDFGVVHRGEGAGGDARRAEIPEEKTEPGGDEAEVEEDEELGCLEIDGDVARERRGECDDEGAGVKEAEDVAVAEGGLFRAETAVEDLAEGEGEIGELDERDAGERAGGGHGFRDDGGTAEDGEERREEGADAKRAVKGVGEERDEKGSRERKQCDLVGGEEAEALVVGEIHEAELHRADAGEREGGARGESAEAEEREEDEQRDAEAGGGEEGAVEAAAGEVLGEAEGAGPKEGDEEEEGHGVETMAGKSKEAGALTLRREGAREWVWRQKLFPSKPLPTRDCGACVAMRAK